MSLAASTAAQRYALVQAANNLAKYCSDFSADSHLKAEKSTTYQGLIDKLQTALTAIANAT